MFRSTLTFAGSRTPVEVPRHRHEVDVGVERLDRRGDGRVVAREVLADGEDARPLVRRRRARREEAVVDRQRQSSRHALAEARVSSTSSDRLRLAEADDPRGGAERRRGAPAPRRRRTPPDQVQPEVHDDDGQPSEPGRERKPRRAERREARRRSRAARTESSARGDSTRPSRAAPAAAAASAAGRGTRPRSRARRGTSRRAAASRAPFPRATSAISLAPRVRVDERRSHARFRA